MKLLDTTYKRLEEYATIGNGNMVVLVGHNGSIDWCPLPPVESSSVFTAPLDSDRGDSPANRSRYRRSPNRRSPLVRSSGLSIHRRTLALITGFVAVVISVVLGQRLLTLDNDAETETNDRKTIYGLQ